MRTRTSYAAAIPALFISLILAGCGKSDTSAPERSTESDSPDSAAVEDTDTLGMGETGAAMPDSLAGKERSGGAMDDEDAMTEPTNFYEISTPLGSMVVRLYDETPKHRDNFRKLVQDGYYDGTTFHRVIEEFMIQGGDGYSKDDDPSNDGQGDIGYTIDAEFLPGLIHKRGALAAARQSDQVNPRKRSSGSQFYIVHGKRLTGEELEDLEAQMKQRDPSFSISPLAAEVYTQVGGTPFLDGQYTVFGELVEGFGVLDRIAAVETPRKSGEPADPVMADRPPEPITMTVRPLPDYTAQ